MQDGPAYREFLEEVAAAGDSWCVPQAEVAAWWSRRQSARLRLMGGPGETRRVECDLAGAVVEVDGGELRVPPFALPAASRDASLPTLPPAGKGGYLGELLAHLGYGHVAIDPGATGTDAAELSAIVERLRASALRHMRHEAGDIAAFRALVAEAHHRQGLPELRLWPLPHRDGRPWRVAVSSRYDVDKAIVNLPAIHELEGRFGLRSTVYMRPMGIFYGDREIRAYLKSCSGHEVALHGEFITTAEQRFGDEFAAAAGEKQYLEELVGAEVHGVCMHGGELRTNTSPRTRDAIEAAGYRYETMYRNRYYLPLHLPVEEGGIRQTLSIGQHFADISVPGVEGFPARLRDGFLECYREAREVGGVFVPVMHPLYFGVGSYLSHPINAWRIAAFLPVFLGRVARMRKGQAYSN